MSTTYADARLSSRVQRTVVEVPGLHVGLADAAAKLE